MRTVQRNKRDVYYALYTGTVEEVDSNGDYTGEYAVQYTEPVKIRANVSPATGQTNLEMFGNLSDYDKVIVTDQVDIPVDENSILWVDAKPTTGIEGYDYVVRRVARSFNSVSIAVRGVDVVVPVAPTPSA